MKPSKFPGREIVKRLKCPFCGMLIDRPQELASRMPGEMPVGSCSCGAVYACDETGHKLGAAMIEALAFACNMDWDLAMGLLPEDDYLEEIIDHYDYVTHRIIATQFFEGRRISGALYFVRVHDDVQEVTAEGVRKRLEKSVPTSPERPSKRSQLRALSKKEVEKLVNEYQVDEILAVAGDDGKIIRNLQRLLYSGDDLLRQRAADVLGQVSGVIAEKDPGTVSKLLQRLFTAIDDTAAFTWGAFEAVGEIIRYRPDLLAGYIPQLYKYLAEETKRVQALEALGRIGKARPDLIGKIGSRFITLVADPDPRVRGNAAFLLGTLGVLQGREALERLIADDNEIAVYNQGELESKTVGELASDALGKL
jgi:hypothetical protein